MPSKPPNIHKIEITTQLKKGIHTYRWMWGQPKSETDVQKGSWELLGERSFEVPDNLAELGKQERATYDKRWKGWLEIVGALKSLVESTAGIIDDRSEKPDALVRAESKWKEDFEKKNLADANKMATAAGR